MRVSRLLKRIAAVKLPNTLKNKIAPDLKKAGLDGNGRFQKPQHGASKAVEILSNHGIELDAVLSSHLFLNKESGRFGLPLAFTNKEDLFSPESISNSELVISYYQLAPNKYEVLAYLS